MRLTIHRFHIVGSLILSTKQQTGLDETFHILPSLLRFSCLQTHVMARAHHSVHRTGRVLGIRHNVFRRDVDGSTMLFNSFIISSTAARVSSTTSRTTGSQATFSFFFFFPEGWSLCFLFRSTDIVLTIFIHPCLFYTLDPWLSLVSFS